MKLIRIIVNIILLTYKIINFFFIKLFNFICTIYFFLFRLSLFKLNS